MPIYDKDGKFIERVYKDGERLRRVYENSYLTDEDQIVDIGDEGLVYSLYDVNYNYGQDYAHDASGASLSEGAITIDVWGKTHELGSYSYDLKRDPNSSDVDVETIKYWATSLNDGSKYSKGLPNTSEQVEETDIRNYKDYNLYAELYRTNFKRRKINYEASINVVISSEEGGTESSAREEAESKFYENGGAKITKTIVSSTNVEKTNN